MNPWWMTSGLISAVLAVVHVTAGGREIHAPMRASRLPVLVRTVWSVVWHAVTAMLVLNGAALMVAGLSGPETGRALAILPIGLSICCAGLFLGYGFGTAGTIRPFPQWIAFAVIAALGLIGLA